jgi:DNA-binding beta-propeller fold protein YncE
MLRRRGTCISIVVLAAILAMTGRPERAQAQGFALEWGSSGSAPGLFNHPAGLGIDAAGDVYVADTSNQRIQKFDPDGNFLAAYAVAGYPSDVAVNSSGSLFVTTGSQVLVLGAGGTPLDAWPNASSGGITFDGAFGIALAPDGSVYVSELGNNEPYPRVLRFSQTGFLMGAWGQRGSGPGEFQKLLYLAVDGTGHVYVVDNENGRIEKFSAAGTYEGVFGTAASSSNENACGKFHDVYGVAVDAGGEVFAADNSSFDHIHLFSAAGTCLRSWGPYGPGPAQFSTMGDIAVGPGDVLYAVDTGHNRVEKFTSPTVAAVPTSWGAIKSIYHR